MITITFYAPTKLSRYVQLLVMKYDGRFKFNPIDTYYGNSLFDITFEGSAEDNYNKFQHRIDILNQPWV